MTDTHTHRREVDLVATEKALRAAFAVGWEAAMAAAETDRQRTFINAQHAFDEVVIHYSLAIAKLHNDGVEAEVVAGSAGVLVGNLIGDTLTSMVDRFGGEEGIQYAKLFTQQRERAVDVILKRALAEATDKDGPFAGGYFSSVVTPIMKDEVHG